MARPAKAREGKCPCGSGVARTRCDPDHPWLVPCIDCGQLFHLTCNRAKRCPACRPAHNREVANTRRRVKRRRRRLAELQLELAELDAHGGET